VQVEEVEAESRRYQFAGDDGGLYFAWHRIGDTYVIEEILEEELSAALGRGRYGRAMDTGLG
jgi:hypothetical protein